MQDLAQGGSRGPLVLRRTLHGARGTSPWPAMGRGANGFPGPLIPLSAGLSLKAEQDSAAAPSLVSGLALGGGYGSYPLAVHRPILMRVSAWPSQAAPDDRPMPMAAGNWGQVKDWAVSGERPAAPSFAPLGELLQRDAAPPVAEPSAPQPGAVPAGAGAGPGPVSQASLDELADKVWRRISRKLSTEQERRGWAR